jgi:hypothetical protein
MKQLEGASECGLMLMKQLERASECGFNANWAFFSFIIVRTSYIRWDDDELFVLDQHASLLKQQSVGRHLDMVFHTR